MPHPFARIYSLPRGPQVRLRLARSSDAPALADLLAQRGQTVGDLDLLRALRFDPRRRLVICATAPVGRKETVVGVAGIARKPGAEPDLLVVDERLTDGLGDVLNRTVVELAVARHVA